MFPSGSRPTGPSDTGRSAVGSVLASLVVLGAVTGLAVIAAVPGGGATADTPARAGALTGSAGALAGVPGGFPQADATNISVTVRGELLDNGSVTGEKELSEGERLELSGDPELALDVRSGSTIDIVSVRVDGRTRRSYVPNASSFNETTELDLDPGPHDVRVVVEADRTTSFAAELVNDPNGPLATFRSPFSAGFVGENGSYSAPEGNYTLEASEVALEADLHDRVGVDRVTVERVYEGEFRGTTVFDRERFRINDPGDSVSRSLRLGETGAGAENGTNALNVTLFDKFGQSQQYDVELRVNDTDDPEIEINNVEPKIERQAATIEFTVRDDVGVESVGYRLGDATGFGLKYLLFGQEPVERPVRESFSQTVRVTGSEDDITLVATDGAGHRTNLTRTVDYASLVRPRIQFVPNETGVVGERVVRVRGEVFDGQIVRVRAETVSSDGDVLDLVAVHGGSVTENVTVDQRLNTSIYPATVRIRAVDATGTEHVESFQLSQDDTLAGAGGSPAVTTPAATPEPPTPTPTPESGGSDGGPESQVVVRNVTLSAATVEEGASVRVNATVHNRGEGNALYTAGLTVGGNVTATESVAVPTGENRTVSLEYVPNETGTYPVAVNGSDAGELTVGSGGGLVASVLGVFGFLPLGLLKPLVFFVGVPALVVYLALKGLAVYLGY